MVGHLPRMGLIDLRVFQQLVDEQRRPGEHRQPFLLKTSRAAGDDSGGELEVTCNRFRRPVCVGQQYGACRPRDPGRAVGCMPA
jgi:hypothetical protein